MNNKKGKEVKNLHVNFSFRPRCSFCKKDCDRSACFAEAMKFTETKEFKEFVSVAEKLKVEMFVIRRKKYDIDMDFMEVVRTK